MEKELFEYPYVGKDITVYQDNFSRIDNISPELVYSDCEDIMPLISIVVPTYNSSFIEEALKSAINQLECPIYEIVVVDNCSDQHYYERLLSFVNNANSKRIRVFRNPTNIGMVGNWNMCIKLARATELVFLHSDDMFPSNTLSLLWKFHNQVEVNACILARHSVINENGTELSPANVFKKTICLRPKDKYRFGKYNLFHADMDSGCGALFNKEVLLKGGGFYYDYYPNIDGAGILHYYLNAPIYRINYCTRITRIAENESLKSGKLYPASSYYARIQIVNRFFLGSRFLKLLVRLNCESMSSMYFGYKPIRRLNFIEKFLVKIEAVLYGLNNKYGLNI